MAKRKSKPDWLLYLLLVAWGGSTLAMLAATAFLSIWLGWQLEGWMAYAAPWLCMAIGGSVTMSLSHGVFWWMGELFRDE